MQEFSKTCAFFGHRDTPESASYKLQQWVEIMITQLQVRDFLVGNNGSFDAMAARTVRSWQKTHSQIGLHLVLAYLPDPGSNLTSLTQTGFDSLLFPEGLETVPKRFAICHRNRWMARQADYLITYVNHSYGGAYQALTYANRLDSCYTINLPDV